MEFIFGDKFSNNVVKKYLIVKHPNLSKKIR